MKYLATLIIVGFLSIILFGFVAIDHGHHEMNAANSTCPIVLLFNHVCAANGASMAAMHIFALQSFANNPIPTIFVALTSLIFLGFIFNNFYKKRKLPSFYILRRVIEQVQNSASHNINKQIHSWLALFENSPALA